MMEKKMLKLMQKPVTFQNQRFSANKFKSHIGKGFSGQIIPLESHRGAEEEPTSPKVSCLGRIKHKNRQRNNKKLVEGQKPKESPLKGFLGKPQEKRSGAPWPHPKVPERVSQAPDLIHMRRFTSGHNMLAGFDWMTHIAPVNTKHRNIYYANEDSEGQNEASIPFSAPIIIGDLVGCGKNDVDLKPRKEINLWKRRTMAQPRPLQIAPIR